MAHDALLPHMSSFDGALANARLSLGLPHYPRASQGDALRSGRRQLQACDSEGRMHSSQEVLSVLSSQGIRIHRETLARVSDELGFVTRPAEAQGAPRNWNAQQIQQLAAHFHSNGWKPMIPLPRRPVADSEGPFRTRDVLAFLEGRGFALHRGTLARISDELGLHTRDEQASTIQRQWTRQQIDELTVFLQDRQAQLGRKRQERERLERERHQRQLADTRQVLSGVDTQVLRALREADPALAERLRSVFLSSETDASPTPAPGHPDPASTSEEEDCLATAV